MRSPFQSLQATAATFLSLWLAVLACFIGCALPVFANTGAADISPIRAATSAQSEPMADMGDCPHHSGSNPLKQKDGSRDSSGRMSCCPLEITIARKANTPGLNITLASGFVLPASLILLTAQFHGPVELVTSIWHTGRDTLLKTRLLRV